MSLRLMSIVTCKIDIKGETKTITMKWSIPDIMKLLNTVPRVCHHMRKEKNREIHPENYIGYSKEKVSSRFHVKMLTLGHNNDIMEIYYWSPTPVILKHSMIAKRHVFASTDKFQLKFSKKYRTVQVNKWHYIATLFKDNIGENSDGSTSSLYLDFIFKVPYDVKCSSANVVQIQLCNDYENHFNNGLLSDVTMKSAEGTEYKVHKAILAARSTVLKAHFEHNTRHPTNIIESPFDSDVVYEVLRFIYCAKVERIAGLSEKLLAAAYYYQLGDLKSMCEEALYKKLTVDNAIEIGQLADLYSAKILKQQTLEFIKYGQTQLLTKTEAWKNLQSVQFVKTLYEHLVVDDDICENSHGVMCTNV